MVSKWDAQDISPAAAHSVNDLQVFLSNQTFIDENGRQTINDVINEEYRVGSRAGLVQTDKAIWKHWTHIMNYDVHNMVNAFASLTRNWSLYDIGVWCKSFDMKSSISKLKRKEHPVFESDDSHLEIIQFNHTFESLEGKRLRLSHNVESQSQPAHHQHVGMALNQDVSDDEDDVHSTGEVSPSRIYYRASNSRPYNHDADASESQDKIGKSVNQLLVTHSKLLADILNKISVIEVKLDKFVEPLQTRKGSLSYSYDVQFL